MGPSALNSQQGRVLMHGRDWTYTPPSPEKGLSVPYLLSELRLQAALVSAQLALLDPELVRGALQDILPVRLQRLDVQAVLV